MSIEEQQLANSVAESMYTMTGYAPRSKRARRREFLSTLGGLMILFFLIFGAYAAYFKLVLRMPA